MRLLHIDSSILAVNSVSRHLTAAIVARLKTQAPGVTITYRDLATDPVAQTSPAMIAAAFGAPGEHATALQHDLAQASAVLDEVFSADAIVVGAPMYNFGIPSQLKAWVDKICVAGKTFKYGASGPEGLLGGRRVFIASARGGVYSGTSPYAPADHQETHLQAVLGFLGIKDITIVRARASRAVPRRGRARSRRRNSRSRRSVSRELIQGTARASTRRGRAQRHPGCWRVGGDSGVASRFNPAC